MEGQVLLSLILVTLSLSNVIGSTNLTKNDPHASDLRITITNSCYETIYLNVLTTSGNQVTPRSMKMDHLDSLELQIPDHWSGRIWAQTSCSGDNNTFHCRVGNQCGFNNKDSNCHDYHNSPPVTLLDFVMKPRGETSSYAINLQHGLNLPVRVIPSDNQCRSITCPVDMRAECPDWFAMYDDNGIKIGCKSACDATNLPKFCCTGAYGSADKCELNVYTKLVVDECPDVGFSDFHHERNTCNLGVSFQVSFFC